MDQNIQSKLVQLKNLLQSYESIGLAYLFGSRAVDNLGVDNFGELSDIDFAVFLSPYKAASIPEFKLDLLTKLSDLFNTDKIDLVIINDSEFPELKFNIIYFGKLVYEVEPYKVEVEPKIYNEYFDFKKSLELAGISKND
jgi:predicted nucleotidyltransferase